MILLDVEELDRVRVLELGRGIGLASRRQDEVVTQQADRRVEALVLHGAQLFVVQPLVEAECVS